MRSLRTLALLLLPLALAALPACNSAKNSAAGGNLPKVAFVSNNPENFWTICEAGCQKAAPEVGVNVLFRKPESGDAAKQKEIIDSLINQEIKAIAVSVIDPKNQTDYLNSVAARVPLIAVDNDAPESKRLAYIGTDNYAAGREVGRLVKEAMPEGGVVAIFVGQLEALNARQRCRGVLDELGDKPTASDAADPQANPGNETTFGKYRLHKIYTDQPIGGSKCKENATDALISLATEKNLCMIGLWAYNPPAILSAVEGQNKQGQVKIVAFDEDSETLKGIDQGYIHATVVQDPYNFGYEAVKLMAKLAKGEKLEGDKVRYVKHRVVTKDGGKERIAVGPFTAELRQRIGKGTR